MRNIEKSCDQGERWVDFKPPVASLLCSYVYDVYHLRCLMTTQQNDLCAQRRLQSAWASTQSDQRVRCAHQETLGCQLPIGRTAQADLSLCWVHMSFCWFYHELAHLSIIRLNRSAEKKPNSLNLCNYRKIELLTWWSKVLASNSHVTLSGCHGNDLSAATICFKFFQVLVLLLPAEPRLECWKRWSLSCQD